MAGQDRTGLELELELSTYRPLGSRYSSLLPAGFMHLSSRLTRALYTYVQVGQGVILKRES
jgi:hypothetical protein